MVVVVVMLVIVTVSVPTVRVRVIAVPIPAVRFGHARSFAARAQNSRRTRRRSVKALPGWAQGPGVSTDRDPNSSRDPNPDSDATAETPDSSDPDANPPADPESAAGVGAVDGAGGDSGYVHAPGGPTGAGDATRRAEPEPTGFGAAGWLLTAAVVICFLIIPGVIYVYPYVLGVTGLGFLGTYLALPLVPAVLLGLIAVWSMSAAR